MKNIEYLRGRIATSTHVQETIEHLQRGADRVAWLHMHGSSPALYLSQLQVLRGGTVLCILSNEDEAGYFFNDLSVILSSEEDTKTEGEESILFFPSLYRRGIRYGVVDPANEILRTQLLGRLREGSSTPKFVVTYPEAVLEAVVDEKAFREGSLVLRVGTSVDRKTLRTQLWDMGFEETDYVYEPGQFAVRGSIIDIFSFANFEPVRIDFFGDEVESLRYFEPETQLSKDPLEELTIMASFRTGARRGVSLLSLLEEKSLMYIDRLTDIQEAWQVVYDAPPVHAEDNIFGSLEEMREVLVDPDQLWEEILPHPLVTRAYSIREEEVWERIDFGQTPEPLFHKNFDLLADNLNQLQQKGFETVIMSNQKSQIERLKSIFEDQGRGIDFSAMVPTLHAGFVDPSVKLACYTDHTIFERFHKYNLKSDKIRNSPAVLTLKEINKFEYGDYIVHINHGIGTFAGLFTIEQNGKKQECIRINYKGGDSIYVSIHSLHHISKYKSKDNEEPPQLNRLGSGAWEKLKQRTKKKVKEIARDLIKLYSQRLQEKGFAFSPDTYLQKELEASFKYEDTPDQLEATIRVKEDMEKPIPMDRLICGDVGFGKTEVAIRAAFKAVADSKQVAVLVPTTVLAHQHYRTFRKRLEDFPCRVEYLSRAKTAKERTQILKDLKEGRIDIIIGTHTLTSKSVHFHDLGLLIIDEEQKFGVAVKEKLRQYRSHIDTLTLTATPIPRTLQFSLMGARDLSNIQTPPPNRYPIRTEVTRMDPELLKEAINYELAREGQVYFVHNRIFNLNDIAETIRKAVPGIRIATTHGQLEPKELERRLIGFANQEYDLLLSTAIIENGIDIPNANTIIINDAQRFGLSDLHQLRGRVGRGDRKAFCYLLTPPDEVLTSDAKRRLKAISTFSELGSGIHIAMQDLDIRGAGNLLGAEQSGFIADLGYETYRRILEESVMELKDEEFSDLFESRSASKSDASQVTEPSHSSDREYAYDTTIETDTEAFFPPEYVPGDDERITLYRELDKVNNLKELGAFRGRLIDRFGELPEEAEELLKVISLRILGKKAGVEKIFLRNNTLRLQLVADTSSAYYGSRVFSNILSNSTTLKRRVAFRETEGTRRITVEDVKSVSEAYDILSDLSEIKLE